MIPVGPPNLAFLATSLDKRQHYSTRQLYEAVRQSGVDVVLAGTIKSSIIDPVMNHALAYAFAWWLAEKDVQHCVFQTSKAYKVVIGVHNPAEKAAIEEAFKHLPAPLFEIVRQTASQYTRMRTEQAIDGIVLSGNRFDYRIDLRPRSRKYLDVFIEDTEE